MNKSKWSIGLLVLAIVMVTGTTFATPAPVPDVGSTSLLMSMAFAGLAAARKLMR